MARLSPFRGWRVRQDAADRVVAPPHDALTPEQRRALAASEPDSFLNVVRSSAEPGTGDRDELLAAARATLQRLVASGAFERLDRPAHHVLRMRQGDHVQTGIVGTVPVRDLGDRVRAHEDTRRDREDELVRHLEVVGVSSSPVGLVHRGPTPVPDLLEEVTRRAPSLELRHADGLQEQVWTLTDDAELDRIRSGFADVPVLYLTDGHHRAAAARRHAGRRGASAGDTETSPAAPWEQFLVVAFPETQLQLLPYHRVVADLGSHGPGPFLEALRRDFDVERLGVAEPGGAAPTERGRFLVHVGGHWHAVVDRDGGTGSHPPDDPVSRLDVTVLQERILAGLLGIEDPRTDPRLEFVPGTRGLADIAGRAGPDGAAFVVAPPSLRQLMAVADAGRVMPPKSTWFEPKLRPGVFLHWVGGEPGPVADA